MTIVELHLKYKQETGLNAYYRYSNYNIRYNKKNYRDRYKPKTLQREYILWLEEYFIKDMRHEYKFDTGEYAERKSLIPGFIFPVITQEYALWLQDKYLNLKI